MSTNRYLWRRGQSEARDAADHLARSAYGRLLAADAAAAWPWERVPDAQARALHLAEPATNLGQGRSRFRLLAQALAGPAVRGDSICDVGAFPGTTLRLIRTLSGGEQVSLSAIGLGFDEQFRDAVAALGVRTIDAEFDVRATPPGIPHLLDLEAADGDAGWDVIVCTEVIEHQLQPLALLIGCHRLLREGGALFLTTNSASFVGDVLKLVAGRHNVEPLERSHILVDHDWRPHLRLYLLEEVEQLLELSGFEVLDGHYFDGGNVYTGSKGAAIATVRRAAGIVPRLRSHMLIKARKSREPSPTTLARLRDTFTAFGLPAPIAVAEAGAR